MSDVGPGSAWNLARSTSPKYSLACVQEVDAAMDSQVILKCSPKLGLSMEWIRLIMGFAGRRRPPYRAFPDPVVARSVQNCSKAQR